MESIKKKILSNFVYFAIVFFSFFIDRISKIYVVNFFLENKIESYFVNSFFNIVLLWNDGIAFGLLSSDNYLYHLTTLVIFFIILFILYLFVLSISKIEKISLSIIVGGAIGNLYDRIIFNAVPDFLDFHYLDFHWFVFNISDIMITFGIVLLIIKNIVSKKNV